MLLSSRNRQTDYIRSDWLSQAYWHVLICPITFYSVPILSLTSNIPSLFCKTSMPCIQIFFYDNISITIFTSIPSSTSYDVDFTPFLKILSHHMRGNNSHIVVHTHEHNTFYSIKVSYFFLYHVFVFLHLLCSYT